MQETLKAYIVTYAIAGKEADKNMLLSVVIVAFNKQEAGDIFIRWAHAKNIYECINAVICQRTRKTKRNAHMLTNTIYKRQYALIEKLEARKADA